VTRTQTHVTTKTFHEHVRAHLRGVLSTECLYARPTVWQGIGSVVDFWGARWPYNYSKSERDADARALLRDWAMVGQDLRAAMKDTDCDLAEKSAEQLALFG
jgi:hypothetical protein